VQVIAALIRADLPEASVLQIQLEVSSPEELVTTGLAGFRPIYPR
jgi:hypothetical protein